MDKATRFFDFAAEVGLTKHIGGLEATDKLAELCRIGKDTYVLDVGCGVGATACRLAGKYGCRVMGIDILPRMVERSRERAKRMNLAGRVEFRTADAQDLPFEDGLFDAVITESVTAFPEDKQKAVNEYVRVVKPGGYIGLNETAWLKVPVPPEILEWVSQDPVATPRPLEPSAWTQLLEKAGVKEIVSRTSTINIREETRGIFQRYGCLGMIGIYFRMFLLYFRNPAYREFLKNVRQEGLTPKNVTEYFGYGLFVGRK